MNRHTTGLMQTRGALRRPETALRTEGPAAFVRRRSAQLTGSMWRRRAGAVAPLLLAIAVALIVAG
jgi:hypothetical protein